MRCWCAIAATHLARVDGAYARRPSVRVSAATARYADPVAGCAGNAGWPSAPHQLVKRRQAAV